jgi:hypothetical protein
MENFLATSATGDDENNGNNPGCQILRNTNMNAAVLSKAVTMDVGENGNVWSLKVHYLDGNLTG